MHSHQITNLCRQLRKNQTESEKQLWLIIRGKNFEHYKFRRQHPFIYQNINGVKSFFIADFYCPCANLIVELDGKIHDFQKDYDNNRDTILQQLGLTTLRIKNETLANDMPGVLNNILTHLKK